MGIPRHRDPAGIAPGGIAGAEDAGKLVGTEQRRRAVLRQHGEERRYLHQSAATDHGVDEPGSQRGQPEQGELRQFGNGHLLADAEAAEDFSKEIVGGEFTGDAAERLLPSQHFIGKQFELR